MPDLVDAVVVGAGILGTAITLALARKNLRVMLLEQYHPGYGATGTGFAWINATYKLEDEHYFRLNARGVAKYDSLAAEWGSERSGIYGGGSLFWTMPYPPSETTPEQERLRQRAQLLQNWNYPVSLLTDDELNVLEPSISTVPALSSNFFPDFFSHTSLSSGLSSADLASVQLTSVQSVSTSGEPVVLFAPNDKWVDTARLCRLFIEQARLHKAEIRANCPASGFTRTTGNAISTVETPQGRISTPLLVLAGGIHTPALVARVTGDPANVNRIPVHQEPGLLVETPALPSGKACRRILYPPDPYALHMRPTPEGGLLIGADDTDATVQRLLADGKRGNMGGAAGIMGQVPDEVWHGLLERAAQWLPELASDEIRARSRPRICIRPVPADGMPVVGTLDEVPGTYVAVTHSGITLAPLLADLLIGEIITRLPDPLTAPYRPSRFK